MVKVKRIYDPPSKDDGKRMLVDRLWPRGIKKKEVQIDEWLKEISPSNELRKWFSHDPEKWEEFRERYRKELKDKSDQIGKIRGESKEGKVPLLFSAKDKEYNNAIVLREAIEGKS